MTLLRVEQVSRSFGGVHALENVSMEVRAGEVHGLIGPNGAGKTTLVNLLTGFYQPSSGRILLNGQNIVGCRPYQISRLGVARTYQNVRLFSSLTPLDNVMVGRHEQALSRSFGRLLFLPAPAREEQAQRKVAGHLLLRLGVDPADPLPAGALSYGDQRRVEIARALATDPHLLLLDEPAAGMNRAETDRLGEVLRTLVTPDRSILLIEHDLPLVMAVCDRITVLNFGHVIASGTPREVARDPAVIEAYLGREDDAAAM